MNPIFIIGYMGAGKTTFGRALARRLGLQFVDLDFYIEQRFRKKISEIFSEKGEDYFRRIEASVLREVGEFEDVVIACGGGTPCFDENMDYMNSRGLTVCLEASVERLIERYRLRPDKRPLLAGKSDAELHEFVEKHRAQRNPFYSKARYTLESSRLENKKEIAETISRFLNKNPL